MPPAAKREDRLSGDRTKGQREPFQRDRDRILYTAAFLRLAEVTQVVSPDEVGVFHNRLTHTLKVSQVARRLAEMFRRGWLIGRDCLGAGGGWAPATKAPGAVAT
jgi:dGTPase